MRSQYSPTGPKSPLSPQSRLIALIGAWLGILGSIAVLLAFFFAIVTVKIPLSYDGASVQTKMYWGLDFGVLGKILLSNGVLALIVCLNLLQQVRQNLEISRPMATFGVVNSLVSLLFLVIAVSFLVLLAFFVDLPSVTGRTFAVHPAFYVLVIGILAICIGTGIVLWHSVVPRLSGNVFSLLSLMSLLLAFSGPPSFIVLYSINIPWGFFFLGLTGAVASIVLARMVLHREPDLKPISLRMALFGEALAYAQIEFVAISGLVIFFQQHSSRIPLTGT